MRLSVTVEPSLPPLAWCVRLGRGDAKILCGTAVEVRADGFFEGAWAGDADSFDFASAVDVFGSGGRIVGDDLIIVTPSHTLERIQYIRRGDETLVSNSLVFLLTAARAELDPHHAGYATDFAGIVYDGMQKFDTAIPVRFIEGPRRTNGEAHLVYVNNACFHRNGRVSFLEKPAGQPFETYDEYVALLTDVLQQTVDNACAPSRAATYSPLASISSGYDSPAVAALAHRVGCTKAFTFTHARTRNAQPEDDSGKPIADVLGYELTEFDREAYRNIGDFPEAEFLATGMSGEDVNMAGLEAAISRTVFFSGHYGGRVWDLHTYPDELLRRGDMSGASMNEFRLRADFVHVPVPFIGARRHPKILEIAQSHAMRSWSIGTDYDRPVPRRIAEDAGVPRADFGHTKRATTALLHIPGDSAWTPQTRDAVHGYAKAQHLPMRTRVSYVVDALGESLRSFTYRVLRRLSLLRLSPSLATRPLGIHSHTHLGPLPMLWATEFIRPRYRAAVEMWRGDMVRPSRRDEVSCAD
ncbi:hypothetical protein EV589_2767 [Mycobacterium sp. BK558]|nr:hypothetical protein EV589_2767 [Mycobacterium sp. BK558]